MAVFYSYVLELTDDVRERRMNSADTNEANEPHAPPGFKLPPNTFIISGRLDAEWDFIQCDGGDDSPVWAFDEIDWVIRQPHASVLDWLNHWCEFAEAGIASGYFDQFPSGTVP